MIPKWHKHRCMGVINITPNSFSDGGKYNKQQSFLKHCRDLLHLGVEIIDFGAESTAPFNSAITFEEEKERFDNCFLSSLDWISLQDITISIDTYRSETFSYIYNMIKRVLPTCHLIWNDISGVIDESLIETLSRCPDIDYVFCHTSTKERSQAQNHMEQLVQENLLPNMCEYFDSAYEAFEKFGLGHRIIFDPCFGFSKDLAQNHQLISFLDDLIMRFPKRQRWLVGISRKSFLKKLTLTEEGACQESEYIHSAILSQWMLKLCDFEIIYRVHDPIVFSMAVQSANIFDRV